MQKRHIDVVADFAYYSHNPDYNRDYRVWRTTNKSPCMYRFSGDPRAAVFVAGDTVNHPSVEMTEQQTITRCSEKIGIALLIFLLIELVGGSAAIWLLDLLGFNIRLDFLAMTMQGSQWLVTFLRSLLLVLKYGIPALLLIRSCKIPRKIAVPVRWGGTGDTIAAAGLAMIVAAIYSLFASPAGVETAQEIIFYKDLSAIIAYGAFAAVIGSFLAELFLRGTILPLLRQFGDAFAVGVTATVACLFPNKLPERIGELLIGLASGYLLVKGGSFMNCVLLRMTYVALCYARLSLVYTDQVMPLWQYVLLLGSFGTLLAAFYAILQRDGIRLKNRRTQLPNRTKLFAMTQTVTTLPWLAFSSLLTLLQIFY